jgi:hypothetical protein
MGIVFLLFSLVCACRGVSVTHPRQDRSVDKIISNSQFVELIKDGYVRDNIDIRLTNYSMGVHATRDFDKGEVVLRIPERVMWKKDRAEQLYPGLKAWTLELKAQVGNEAYVGYSVALVYLRHVGELPLALEVVPKTCISGSDLRDDVARAFPSHDIPRSEFAGVTQERDRYSALVEVLPEDLHISYEDFLWGVCTLRSRCYLDYRLIPIADLIGHDFALENVLWNIEDGDIVYRAKNHVQKGDELWTTYGCHTKLTTLFVYGFATPATEDECNKVNLDGGFTLSFDKESSKPVFDSYKRRDDGYMPGKMTGRHRITPGTNEIDVEAGEIVTIHQTSPNSWAEVTSEATGKRGWVPLSLVEREHIPVPKTTKEGIQVLRRTLDMYPAEPENLNAEVRKVRDANMKMIRDLLGELEENSEMNNKEDL